MTCIVGAIDDDGTVWMAGDSAGVSGTTLRVRMDEKVFVRRVTGGGTLAMVFGFTSSFRMGQLLRYSFQVPEKRPRQDWQIHEWMCTEFVDAVRKVLSDGGWMLKKDERTWGGTFLVGIKGRLFEIDSDFQVGEARTPFAAVGCGDDYALGAMAAMQGSGIPAHEAVVRAVGIAEQFSAGVRGPVRIAGVTIHGDVAEPPTKEV